MRKPRLQKQNRRLLTILCLLLLTLIGSFFIYIGARGELLLKDLRIFVEKGLSDVFKSKVAVGDVRGGIFYPITFSNIVLYDSAKGQHKLLEVNNVRVNYHLWDLVFNRKKHTFKVKLLSPNFFVLPQQYYEDKVNTTAKHSFFVPYIQVDIVNGSIVSYDAKEPLAKQIHGRIELSSDVATFENIRANFYELPVRINGSIDGVYSDSPSLDMDFELKNNYIKASTHAKGPFEHLSTKGSFSMANGIKMDFSGFCKFYKGGVSFKDTLLGDALKIDQGYIDLNEKRLSLRLLSQQADASQILIDGDFADDKISLHGNLKHWPVGGLDVVTNMNLEAEVKQKERTPTVTGVFNTTNTIINYRPCEELSLQFALKRKALEILGLKWGRTFRLVGKLEFEPPYAVEAIALLDGTKLEELASFSQEGLHNVVAGSIKGRLEIDGPLATSVSRGHITSRNGKLGDIYYENAVIHLVGKGPLITIGDSRIYKETGYLVLSGEIDLRELGKRNIFENILVKTDDQTIIWEGWDITKEPATEKVSLKKRISDEWEVGFKAPMERTHISDEKEEESELEVKYKILDHESLKIKLKEEEEFMGVEHKIKF